MPYILQKGGKLVEEVWNSDTESYDLKDVTYKAIRLFAEPCQLEEGVTLRDLFLLLNTELELFNCFYGNWLKEIVTEGLTVPHPEAYTGVYDPDGIEYLELYWYISLDKQSLYGYNRPSFHGIGFELQDNIYHDWEPKTDVMYHKGDRINWSLCMTPTNKIIDLPLKLNTVFNIYNEDVDAGKGQYGRIMHSFADSTYTLGNIIDGIIWELSFHGGPDKRSAFRDKILGMVDDIKNTIDNPEE